MALCSTAGLDGVVQVGPLLAEACVCLSKWLAVDASLLVTPPWTTLTSSCLAARLVTMRCTWPGVGKALPRRLGLQVMVMASELESKKNAEAWPRC